MLSLVRKEACGRFSAIELERFSLGMGRGVLVLVDIVFFGVVKVFLVTSDFDGLGETELRFDLFVAAVMLAGFRLAEATSRKLLSLEGNEV